MLTACATGRKRERPVSTYTFRFHRAVSDSRYDLERARCGADFTDDTLDRALRALEGNLDHTLRVSNDDGVGVERKAKTVNKHGKWTALTLRLTAPLSNDEVAMTAADVARSAFLLVDPVAP